MKTITVWVRKRLREVTCAEAGCNGCLWVHRVIEGIEMVVEEDIEVAAE